MKPYEVVGQLRIARNTAARVTTADIRGIRREAPWFAARNAVAELRTHIERITAVLDAIPAGKRATARLLAVEEMTALTKSDLSA